jgi:hypothetical protein
MKAITKLKKLAGKAGSIEVVDKGNGHIQLKGALLVNYYPDSKNQSCYVAGTTGAKTGVSPEQAVAMCSKAPAAPKRKDKRRGNSRKKRAALIKRGVTSCCWCNTPLTLDTSTLEHVIPLDLGGLDNDNNTTLACATCNNDRGNTMPELTTNQRGRHETRKNN